MSFGSLVPDLAGSDYNRRRNTALDGLRGYAAAQVVILHSILILNAALLGAVYMQRIQDIHSTYLRATKLAMTVANESAVVLFFLLSGAVLFDSLHRSSAADRGLVSLKFAFRRILRIYPTLLVCLVVLYAVNQLLADLGLPGVVRFTPDQLIDNLLLTNVSMHGATWTLQVEMLAVPFLLISYVLAGRWGYWGLGAALAYALGAFFYLPLAFGIPALGSYLFLVAAGCWIPTELCRRAVERLPSGTWVVVLAGMLSIRIFLPLFSVGARMAQAACGVVLVGLVYYRKAGALSRGLECEFSQRLGISSYSFYLYNVVIMSILLWLVVPQFPVAASHPLEAGLVLAAITTMLTMPVARLSYDYVEVPFMRLGQVMFGARSEPGMPRLPAKLSVPRMRELLLEPNAL